MTSYRLFPSGAGPALVSFGGSFRAGVVFCATEGGTWFDGWWWWVPAGGDTGAQLFALWAMTGAAAGVLQGSATSGPLTANSWNFIPYTGSPVNLAMGFEYLACTGWTAVNGFPDTNSFYAANPVTNGPLTAYSDTGGSRPSMFNTPQGVFDTSAALVTTSPCTSGSNSANFGMDIQIRDTVPAGYTGSFRGWPTPAVPPGLVADSAVPYTGGNEFHLSEACTLNTVYFYSDAGSAGLPVSAAVWSIATGLKVASQPAPAWSGAAGSGWVSAAWPASTVLGPGAYRLSVYDSRTEIWFSTVNSGDPWGTGIFGAGVVNGPLSFPNLASASEGYNYNAGDPGSTPPFTDGTQRPAQSVFGQSVGGAEIFPQLVAAGIGGSSQWYPVDIAVTPLPSSGGGGGTGGTDLADRPFRWKLWE